MKNKVNAKCLPFTALAAGLAGWFLRALLYAVAVDGKNLLPVLHPIELVLWLVIAAAAAVLLLQVRKLAGSDAYEDNFGPSVTGAMGSLVMAGGILVTVLTMTKGIPGPASKLWTITGFLSAFGLAAAALLRLKGKQPFFLCHFVVCVFFLLHLVSRYQSWSGNPQLQDYVFCLGGSVLLALFAYCQTAFDVDFGGRQMQLAVGLLGGVFCFTALGYSQTPALYLAGGIWMLTELCNPVPVCKTEEAAPEQEEPHGDS